ncbi:MAG: hypothetical protein HY553_16725 [Elusimicrobia bacterium]|nr:hypothetical protein [Elusimicrobiota bacterium]
MKTPTTFRELREQREEHEYRLLAALLGWPDPFARPFVPITETRRPQPTPPPATERQVRSLIEALGVRPEMEPAVADRLARALTAR